MTIDERISNAEARRDDAISNGTINDVVYWNGYIDGLKAVKRSESQCQKVGVKK